VAGSIRPGSSKVFPKAFRIDPLRTAWRHADRRTVTGASHSVRRTGDSRELRWDARTYEVLELTKMYENYHIRAKDIKHELIIPEP
jgi:hypothetical protein